MNEFKLTLRTDKIVNSKAPIHYRLFIKGKPIYISSGISIHPRHWNEDEGIISKSLVNSKRMNNQLNSRLEELNELLPQVVRRNPNASRKALRSLLITNKDHHQFFKVAENYLQEILVDGEIGTHDDRKSKIAKFKGFVKNDDLTIEDLSDDLMYKYKKYLMTVKGNQASTTNSSLKCIRAVFNFAVKRYKIKVPFNPFFGFEFAKEEIKRVFLTEEELNQFASAQVDPKSKLAVYKDMFLFAAKGFGIRVSDLLFLKWKDFDGYHFDYNIFKTKKQSVIKASMALKQILSKYKHQHVKPDDFIFPVLIIDPAYEDATPIEKAKILDKAISRATSRYNKGLKQIAEKAGITKNISSHVARHTFATIVRSKGMDLFDLRDFLKHSNVRETEIYAGTVDPKLDKLVDQYCLN
ncbi:MAG: hypothetical protein OJF59_000574 [Cytophagales bacterium]|jgi:site-specific recombinase XerD|nr:site-specific integrase [Bacteroidota bacterium]WHZ06821.1 MAG: hypothetical protein OJF59_000574 [Cytophagales bacterium]